MTNELTKKHTGRIKMQKQFTVRLPAEVCDALEAKEKATSIPTAMLIRAIVVGNYQKWLGKVPGD